MATTRKTQKAVQAPKPPVMQIVLPMPTADGSVIYNKRPVWANELEWDGGENPLLKAILAKVEENGGRFQPEGQSYWYTQQNGKLQTSDLI